MHALDVPDVMVDCPMSLFRPAAALFLSLALPVAAETQPADCTGLAALLQSFSGYELTAPPAGDAEGWCVLDGATLQAAAADRPDLKADHLRLRGTVADGVPMSVELDLTGLRLVTGLGGKTIDPGLQAMFRLQSADLQLAALVNPVTETLEIRGLALRFSGGTDLTLGADIRGAGLSPLSLAAGSLTALDLDWRNDGKLLVPVMEAAGAGLVPDASGEDATKAARAALAAVVEALPEAIFVGEGRDHLTRLAAALPQGRGRLRLSLTSADGIGAARLIMAGMADVPLAPETMAVLFAGASLSASWQPGLAP